MKTYWSFTGKYFRTVFRCCKKEAVLLIVKAAADGIIPCIQVYVLAQLIDTFTVFVQYGPQKGYLAGYAALLILAVAYTWMSGRLGAVVSERMNAGIRESFCMELTAKCARIRYDLFECSKTQDQVRRALTDTEGCMAEIWNSVISLCVLAVQALGIIALVAVYSWQGAALIYAALHDTARVFVRGKWQGDLPDGQGACGGCQEKRLLHGYSHDKGVCRRKKYF